MNHVMYYERQLGVILILTHHIRLEYKYVISRLLYIYLLFSRDLISFLFICMIQVEIKFESRKIQSPVSLLHLLFVL